MALNNYLLLGLFAVAFILVFSLFGGFVIAMGLVFVAVLVLFLTELKRDTFSSVRSHNDRIAKDHRFEIRKGQTVELKNYDLSVKFLKVDAPKTDVHANTPRILRILVFREPQGKEISFDVNNLRASRASKAFGCEFNFLDFRNGRAVLSIR